MPPLDLTNQKYKLLKHFFKKVYGIEFDTFYPIKSISDITSEDAAREYMKFMQMMHFADTTNNGRSIPARKVDSFRDKIFTKRIECKDDMKTISESKRLDSASANKAIGMFYLIKVIEQTMTIYKGVMTSLDFNSLEQYYLPPKTDFIKKLEADPIYHSKEMLSWIKDFNPLDYSDDPDADLHLPTVKVDIEFPSDMENPFGDESDDRDF